MKFNQILPVIAIYVVALGGCSNTTPDYSEFYKDPETVKEEDPSLNDNQIKVMSFNIRYYNTNDTGDKSWETRTTAFIPMIEDQKPTVIGIQEARPPQLKWLEENWKDYGYIGNAVPTMPTMMSLFPSFIEKRLLNLSSGIVSGFPKLLMYRGLKVGIIQFRVWQRGQSSSTLLPARNSSLSIRTLM